MNKWPLARCHRVAWVGIDISLGWGREANTIFNEKLIILTPPCYNNGKLMNNRRLTVGRLIVAIVTTGLEEVAIWAIWRWALPEWDINLSVNVLIGIMVAWGVFSVTLFIVTTRILKKQVPAGLPSMVGTKGKAASVLSPEGMVRIKGELWTATAGKEKIAVGDDIEVVGEDGLRLVVEKRGSNRPKR